MIKFSIGGRNVDPNSLKDALLGAMLNGIRAQISEKVGAIRDPETGEFPTVTVRGDDFEHLTLHVEGSPRLVALVKERLGIATEEEALGVGTSKPIHVFLSYTSDDLAFAKRIAEALNANGVETWWDKWCISPGDSLRRKIDEGIADCTHFLVLLTPRSIQKPWVNQEMDAALVRSLNEKCKFLPVRYELPLTALPPLLTGMHSPEIATDEDISQLINDIYGVSRRPPLGKPPTAVSQANDANTGYSHAATAIARWLVEHSKLGLFADPQIGITALAANAGLSTDDTADALYELSTLVKKSGNHVLVNGTLFAEFDRYWKPWNAAEDALRLASDIVSDPHFPSSPQIIAERYEWEPRRLNPVISYMLERQLIQDYRGIGTGQFATHRIVGNDHTRRFVKGRV